MTSYQRLKAERDRLAADVRELCLNPNGERATMLKLNASIADGVERAFFAGIGVNPDAPTGLFKTVSLSPKRLKTKLSVSKAFMLLLK